MAMVELKWDDISKVATKAFQLTDRGSEIKWAKDSWQILTKAGLTSYGDRAGRLRVVLRLFAMIAIYYDFFSKIMQESEYELRGEEWLDDFGISGGDLRLLDGAVLADDKDVEDSLVPLISAARTEVYNALNSQLGSTDALFKFLYRSLYPDDEEDDILNHDTDIKGAAYEWVEEGCGS